MIKVLELFGGIGACTKALEKLDIEHELVDYVEIDKYAVMSFNAIHGTDFKPQDIQKWDKDIEVDLIMHGSPCQDFSLAGHNRGGDEGSKTRSSLMYETLRIVDKLRPKYVIWENVKNLLGKKHKHNFYNYLDRMWDMGYRNYYQVLNSKDYGIPQNRKRIFTVSIRKDIDKKFSFPKKQELKLSLRDLKETDVDEKYYLSEKTIEYISARGTKNFQNRDSRINLDIARPLTSTMQKMHRAGSDNYISDVLPNNFDLSIPIKVANKKGYEDAHEGDSVNFERPNSTTRRERVGVGIAQCLMTKPVLGVVEKDLRIRRLTPLECFRLMGFDDEDYWKASQVNSDTQLYKQTGNSIVVNVLEQILTNLLIQPESEIEGQMSIFDYL